MVSLEAKSYQLTANSFPLRYLKMGFYSSESKVLETRFFGINRHASAFTVGSAVAVRFGNFVNGEMGSESLRNFFFGKHMFRNPDFRVNV